MLCSNHNEGTDREVDEPLLDPKSIVGDEHSSKSLPASTHGNKRGSCMEIDYAARRLVIVHPEYSSFVRQV